MAPTIPFPGTPSFQTLLGALQGYLITPADVSLETPSQRLSDVALVIGLMGQRITLRITYGWLELVVSKLFAEDLPILLDISEKLFEVFIPASGIDASGHGTVVSRSHLGLSPLEVDGFLRSYLKGSDSLGIVPEAMVYKRTPQGDGISELRVVIARSLVYSDSLFVDLAMEYESTISPKELGKRIDSDFDRILVGLGLNERATPNGNA